MRLVTIVGAVVLVGCGEIMSSPGGSSEHAAPEVIVRPETDGGDAAATCAVPIVHNAGIGRSYLSCASLGTYDRAHAALACETFVGNQGGRCILATFGDCAGEAIVWVDGLNSTGTWDYAGAAPGRVRFSKPGEQACPDASNPKWD